MAKFYFVNGREGSSKEELLKEIKSLTKEEFEHHVNQERNDFANYTRDVLKREDLAEELEKASSKNKVVEILSEKKKTPTPTKKKTTSTKEKSKPKTTTKKTRPLKSKKVSRKNNKKIERIDKPRPRHIPTRPVSYVSTETPHTFILKEFLLGALFGLLLGLILMAMLINQGIYF